MSTKITNIARNTSYFTIALILQKIIAFLYFTLVARHLPPEDLGKFYLAISLTTLFSIFTDIGLSNVLVREVAKAKNDNNMEESKRPYINASNNSTTSNSALIMIEKLLSNVLSIKLPLTILTVAAVIMATWILGYPPLIKYLVLISSLAMVLDSFTLTFYAVIRGHHNLKWESIGSVLFQVIVLIFGLIVLQAGGNLKLLMLVMVIASGFNFTWSFLSLRSRLGVSVRVRFDYASVGAILILTWPFGLYAILQRLFTYLDTVLLSLLADERSVGLYQVAFKIIFALQFLPLAFTASLYPAFATYWKSSKSQLIISFERAMNYLSIISLPIAAGGIALGNKIIAIFRPEYADALLPLSITLLALVFMFLNYPIGSLLNACDRQSTNTLIIALGLALSVGLNIFLIPRQGAVGASVTVVLANAFMFFLGLFWARRITLYRLTKIFDTLAKAFLSSIVMAILAWYLKEFWSIIFIIPLCGIVYFGLLYGMKAVKKEDITSVLQSFTKSSA